MESLLKKIVAILTLLVLVCAVPACAAEQEDAAVEEVANVALITKTMTACNWMDFIRDDTLISDISVPGTHDSGAQDSTGINIFGRNQSLTLTEQLEAGVRAFDMRFALTGIGLRVFHNFLDLNLSFDDVEVAFQAFLQEHPSETLVVIYTQEDDTDYEEFSAAMNAKLLASDMYYTGQTIPTLGEVRGKVMVLRRYDSDEEIGVSLVSAEGIRRNRKEGLITIYHDDYAIHWQDNYCLDNGETTENKWSDILALYSIPDIKQGDLLLNFVSCYYELELGAISIPKISETAEEMNALFAERFAVLPDGNYGMMMLDFITPELAEMVYQKNF